MRMIEDWRRVAPKLWSVRLSLLAALLSAVETGLNLHLTGTAPLVVVGSMCVSLVAAIARVVAQPSVQQGEVKNG